MFSSQVVGSSQSQTLVMGSSFANVDATGKKARQEDKQPCLAVTVRSIEAAIAQRTDDSTDVSIHGVQPGMLILVGLLESVARQSASVDFTLNDTTGRIKARYYMTDSAPALDGIEPGRYVSVAAVVRTSPEVHLSVTCLRAVTSADEVSFHFIECAHTALKLHAAPAAPAMTTPMKNRAGVQEGGILGKTMSPPKEPESVPVVAPLLEAAAPKNLSTALPKGPLTGIALRDAVLEFLRGQEARDEGFAISFICERLGAGTSLPDVRSCVEKLVDDGEAFTTVDDDHISLL